jgi:hypothetical protein
MGGQPCPRIACALCSGSVTLETDLCADENGELVHEDCYVNHLLGARTNQTSAQHFLDMLAAQPPVLSCPTCGQALLQLDATFLSQTGKSWMIPLPVCMNCHRGNGGAGYADA